MSLNEIKLTPNLLTDMYSNSLVQLANETHPPAAGVLKHLGSGAKNIVILTNSNNTPFLPDNELLFLTSILSACKLNMADVAIVNTAASESRHLQQKMDHLNAVTVLMFDVEPATLDLPIHFPQYQVQHFNSRTYLHAPSLTAIESDKAVKLKFWNSLKNLFGL